MSSDSSGESSNSASDSSSTSSSASLAIESNLSDAINAVIAGQTEDVQAILNDEDSSIELEGRDSFGRTLLMLAAEYGHISIARLLLDAGADINSRKRKPTGSKETKSKKNIRGRTPLGYAAIFGHVEIVKLFIEPKYSQDLNLAEADGYTPLHLATEDDNIPIVELLLDAGAKLECRTKRGKTPLHLAAWSGHATLTKRLLDRGASIEAKDRKGLTPLLQGLATGHESVVRILLEGGANASASDAYGDQGLHTAAEEGFTAGVEMMLDIPSVDIEAGNYVGATPLHSAAQNGHVASVLVLIDKNANLYAKDRSDANNQQTPFEKSITHGHAVVARALLKAGFDFASLTKKTQIAILHQAAEKGHRECVQLLVREGVDPGAVDVTDGDTALHLAANKGHDLVVRFLLEEGVDINAKNFAGETALERAKGKDKVLRLLTIDRPLVGKPRMEELSWKPARPASMLGSFSPEDAVSNEFEAIVVDVCLDSTEHLVIARPSVYDLIYGAGPAEIMAESHSSRGKNSFRWYHLPANNMVWMQDLLKRIGRENGSDDSEVKAKQALFDWQQQLHRGAAPHACFMRPKCKSFEDYRQDNGKEGNVELYMPFLSFETDEGREKLQKAITGFSTIGDKNDADSKLVKAYMPSFATKSLKAEIKPLLHVRRTLDQFLYYALDDTSARDQDQVVYRYTKSKGVTQQLFMVDQLWLWVFDGDNVITCFPQRWNQPKGDKHNVIHYIFEELRSDKRRLMSSVYDLAILITNCCASFVDHCLTSELLPLTYFEVYESSIGLVTHKETNRFSLFNVLLRCSAGTHPQHYDPSVDDLFNITPETELLTEIRDIRDELNMLRRVLEEQKPLLKGLLTGVRDLATTSIKNDQLRDKMKHWIKSSYQLWLTQSENILENRQEDVENMDRLALRTYDSLNQLLDLKQRQANAMEARYARLQAEDTSKQGRTVMVFTAVTIVFLPLSFMAAFFAINISEFSKEADGSLGLAYVCRYLVGVSVALIVPMIVIALNLSHLSDFYNAIVKACKSLFLKLKGPPPGPALGDPGAGHAAQQRRRSGAASNSVDDILNRGTETVVLHTMPKTKARSLDLEDGRRSMQK